VRLSPFFETCYPRVTPMKKPAGGRLVSA
jgi:hypothetical protein